MYLAMYLSFQGNFVIDKYLKMAALEPFSCSVFFCGMHWNYRKFEAGRETIFFS